MAINLAEYVHEFGFCHKNQFGHTLCRCFVFGLLSFLAHAVPQASLHYPHRGRGFVHPKLTWFFSRGRLHVQAWGPRENLRSRSFQGEHDPERRGKVPPSHAHGLEAQPQLRGNRTRVKGFSFPAQSSPCSLSQRLGVTINTHLYCRRDLFLSLALSVDTATTVETASGWSPRC